jgi:signal transduction histidine kinase
VKKLVEFWSAAVDLLIDGVLGPLWLTLTVTFYAFGFALIPAAGFGVLLLVVAGDITRLASQVERGRAIALYDIAIQAPDSPELTQVGWRGLLERARVAVVDPHTWRLMLHNLLSTVLGLGLIGFGGFALTAVVFVGVTVNVPLCILTALVAVLALVVYIWLVGRLDRMVVAQLLGRSDRQRLLAQVGSLADARRGAVDAASLERERIERDLHDGIQPGLVSVAMSIDMARNKLDTDPVAARALLDQAHADAKSSITELRELARGIHPAVLVDRGLDAALSAIAARCSVPTTVEVDLPERPSAEVEAVVYFTVTEALTNVAKHSGAHSCTTIVEQRGTTVMATVADDGIGGARVGEGLGRGGLSGMADRARAAGGRVLVDSPAGGPTVITVEIPCAS